VAAEQRPKQSQKRKKQKAGKRSKNLEKKWVFGSKTGVAVGKTFENV
jgi:hypothetical protein